MLNCEVKEVRFKPGDKIQLKSKYASINPEFVGKVFEVIASEQDLKPSLADRTLVKDNGKLIWIESFKFEQVIE